MDEAELKPLVSAVLAYRQAQITHEKITAQLFDDKLVFNSPCFTSTLRLGTLLAVSAAEYRIIIVTNHGDIELSMLGHLYEDFAHKLLWAFNEMVFKQLLMSEKAYFEASGQYTSSEGQTSAAVFRICETALVILPQTHMLVRVPYCMIAQMKRELYRFEVTDRRGRIFVLQKLGWKTENFLREYDKRIAELRKQTREKLSLIAPADDALAQLLMEGMIVPEQDVRALSSVFADGLHNRLLSSQITQEYSYIRILSEDMAIGIKRGLMGALTGEIIHTLTPVFEKNLVIMESLGEGAAATYLFRMSAKGQTSRDEWRQWLLSFNDSMLAVNYRREPIYLSEEALAAEKHEHYRGALHRSEGLRRLRELFVGRVSHSGFESWKEKLEAYLY